jgi:purine-binding chemotaxis protein CheW
VNTSEPRNEADSAFGSAAALRRLFDGSFAVPAALKAERLENLLAIRVGGDPYALRLSEVGGLYADIRIVPVPSPSAQLLGIVGLRGMMAPVYDLATLLRYAPATGPRWMVLAGAPEPMGFAFETFEAHLQVAEESLTGGANENLESAATRQHVYGAVRAAGALRPIIRMASVMKLIRDTNS